MHWACLLQTRLSSEEAQSSLLKCLAQWMTTARPSRKVTLDQVALGALQAGWRHGGWIQKNRSTEPSSNCWTTQCWATKMVVVFKLPSLGVVSSVQLLSRVWFFAIPWIAARQASLSVINSQSLLKLMSIESVMPSNHLILCRTLLHLPSMFPSIRVFSFLMSQFFASGGQSIGVSASASVLKHDLSTGKWWGRWYKMNSKWWTGARCIGPHGQEKKKKKLCFFSVWVKAILGF